MPALRQRLARSRPFYRRIAGLQAAAIGDSVAAPDVTPPVLTLATDINTGATTGTIGVTTNEDTGILYWVLTLSGTTPSAAQIKAGQNNVGGAAVQSATPAVTTSGIQSFNLTGLTVATTYFAHFVHEDQFLNQSNTISGDGFTTAALGGSGAFPLGPWLWLIVNDG